MRTYSILLVLIWLLPVRGNAQNRRPDLGDEMGRRTSASLSDADVLEGVVVVRFGSHLSLGKNSTTTGILSFDERMSSIGVRNIVPILSSAMLGKKSLITSAIEGIFRIHYTSDISPRIVSDLLSDDPDVIYAEPLYQHRISNTPNDSLFGTMGQFATVEAEAAWDIIKGGSGSVVVAIVDGGTDWNHEDLLANVWTNLDEIPDNGLDDDENGFVDDNHGWNFALGSNDPTGIPQHPQNSSHGTHVAGIAAAVTNNNIGISSISWNAKFMPVNSGSPFVDDNIPFGYDGITYAAANGADVINCSWGRSGGGSRFEQDIIDFAYQNGSLVVAAAGNESKNSDVIPHFPSSYRHVLSVGATNGSTDIVGSFSNYGVSVDVFAPGVSILSTTPANTYSPFFSGTSMASPMVAGLVALVKTRHPTFSVDEVREQVRTSSDLIDSTNPALSGLLGRGRINARRAVTETSNPSVRILQTTLTESVPDDAILPGEIISVEIEFVNFLADAPGMAVTLSTPDAFTTLITSEETLGAIGSGQTGTATFSFQVSQQVPIHHDIRFYVDLAGAGYEDRDVFVLVANPSQAIDHDTGTVQTSITTEGNIGALGFIGEAAGVGFLHDGSNYLFEGGLMIGTGELAVSDCIRGLDSEQDSDFKPAAGSNLVITSPGLVANEEGSIVLVDSLAGNPLGITVEQESFADTSPENQDFVIFRYTVTNDKPQPIENLHIGLFFDWDIQSGGNNWSEYDAPRKMGYVADILPNPTHLVATRLLTSSSGVSYRAVDNIKELFENGFTNLEKWSFLSGGIQTTSLNGRDISQLTSEGPFSIDPGESVQVAFAVIGASSLEELNASADQAMIYFDSLPTATDSEQPPALPNVVLHHTYPNPFRNTTTVSFSLPVTSSVELSVFDVLGRRVSFIANDVYLLGPHEVVWNGRASDGQPVAPGVYFIRLRAGGTVLSRSVVLTR